VRYNATGQIDSVKGHDQQLLNITSVRLGNFPWLGEVGVKNILSTQRTLQFSKVQDLGGSPPVNGANYGGYDIINYQPAVTRAAEQLTDFFDNFSEEFQLHGTIGGKHDWLLGYYMERQKTPLGLPYLFGIFRNVLSPVLSTPGFAGPLTEDSLNQVRGYFGQFTADLSPVLEGLHLTGGYRWSESYSRMRTFNAVVTPTGVIAGAEVPSQTLDDQAPSWTGSLDWQINPSLLTYIASRRGFNPGGVNGGAGGVDIPGIKLTFKPETVTDAELGMKSQWQLLGRPIRTNVALYREWYNNVQRFETLLNPNPPYNTISQTNNIAQALITGFEFQGVWAATARLSLELNYSYMDAKYTKWPGTAVVSCGVLCNTNGRVVPLIDSAFVGAPKNQGTLEVRYLWPLGPSVGNLTASVNYHFQSADQTNDQYLQTGDTVGVGPAYGLLNLRLDWANVFGQPIDASFFVRNVADHVQLINTGSLLTAIGNVIGTYSEPRMWGGELRYRFGASR
jgi:iron complex outermembrane receptor protein